MKKITFPSCPKCPVLESNYEKYKYILDVLSNFCSSKWICEAVALHPPPSLVTDQLVEFFHISWVQADLFNLWWITDEEEKAHFSPSLCLPEGIPSQMIRNS